MFGWKTKTHGDHRVAEASGAFGGAITPEPVTSLAQITRGLARGTHVASNLGWRPVEALAVGDKVLTFDHGMQPIREIRRETIWVDAAALPRHMQPVTIPSGALGNREELLLLPEQGVLVECEAAQDAMGDPFAVLPAAAMVGYRGICRRPVVAQMEVVTLGFDGEQVIYAEGGLLLHCPPICITLDRLGKDEPLYDVLSGRDAAFLVDCMSFEDQCPAGMQAHAMA